MEVTSLQSISSSQKLERVWNFRVGPNSISRNSNSIFVLLF